MTGRTIAFVLLAGWLAESLARPDGDVEAGIEAYEAGDLPRALEHFEAAQARHGDRPELSLNRGLVLLAQGRTEPARNAFKRASEAEDLEVRASGFYERGNVAFDDEQWDLAIEAYIECLKARPDHANAKWNLELALQRKQEQEDEQDQEDEDQEDEDQEDDGGTGGEDTGGSDESGGSDTGGDTGGSDTGGETGGDTGGSDTGGETGDDGTGDDGTGGTGGTGEPPPEPEDDEAAEGEPPPPQQPDVMDIQKALDELDRQDHFPLDRPKGGLRPPTEDW